MSISLDVHPDFRVLAFTAVLAMKTGVTAGIAPGLAVFRRSQNPAMRVGAPTAISSGSGTRLGSSLLVVQFALSLVVVFAGVLLTRTLRNLETLDPAAYLYLPQVPKVPGGVTFDRIQGPETDSALLGTGRPTGLGTRCAAGDHRTLHRHVCFLVARADASEFFALPLRCQCE
jgi:hypothetical protein